MVRRSIQYLSLILFFISCSRKPCLVSWSDSHLLLNEEKTDTNISNILMPYKTVYDREMNDTLVWSEDPLIKGQPEGSLGNFVADCVLDRAREYYNTKGTRADLVLLNNGGLRVSLPKGAITKGKIFELMPFDNEMVLTEISGKKMTEMLNFVADKGGMPIAGLRMEIDKNKNATNISINQLPLDTNKIYGVVSSDYLVQGGDNIQFFKEGKKYYSKLLIRDILIDYCRKTGMARKKLTATTDGRISIPK